MTDTATNALPAADVAVLRELAREVADIAAKDVQEDRRRLWRDHMSLRPTRPLVLATYGMWNVWCRDVFGDVRMKCTDPQLRIHERQLRMWILQDRIGDDYIIEPWISQGATRVSHPDGLWGVRLGVHGSGVEGGAWSFDPPIREWSDVDQLVAPRHEIDQQATQRDVARLHEAVGDILPVNVDRGPICRSFSADLSTDITRMRGLEQLMIDMYESPDQLHKLLAFMRDAVLAVQDSAEREGDFRLTTQDNQAMTYSHELPDPQPNSSPVGRKDLWGFCAAQEYALISPEMHDEFLLQYQLPILSKFGLTHYGCCEDLTRKIDMLRQVPNLRSIAVAPRADVTRCAEQIGTDYVISWRPNPADMVCCGWDEQRVRRILREGLAAMAGCRVHIHLKDIETVEGDLDRLSRWVRVVREVIDEVWE